MKKYLGDGAYVDFDGWALVLTAENGIMATDRIVLEPAVWANLERYVAELKAAVGDAEAKRCRHGVLADYACEECESV